MRRAAGVLTMLLLPVLPVAWAQLEADTAGGPLTLPDEVEAAFGAWQAAFGPEELEEPAAAVAYAPELLGPDTASLTLRWGDGRTEVLLAPARYAAGPVLAHEVGLLLGVPAGGTGVMDPVLDEASPAAPTDEDVARLRDVRTYAPADLTRDGAVDFYDLAAFGAAYGSVGVNLRADLNGDGRVDDEDLAILRAAYAVSAPSRTPPAPANLGPVPAEPADGEVPAEGDVATDGEEPAGDPEEPPEPDEPEEPPEPGQPDEPEEP